MLELFLFVNPIGCQCLEAEHVLLKLAAEQNQEAKIKFIPYVSLSVINKYMTLNQLDKSDLSLRNRLTQNAYCASLDFKAVSFQGAKKSRNFLINLQSLINDQHRDYNQQTVQTALRAANVDIGYFNAERHNPRLQHLCSEDDNLISEFQINDAPTVVIYNYASKLHDNGVLIENCNSYPILKHVFDQLAADELVTIPYEQQPLMPYRRIANRLHTL
ncbi:hypothetical protein FC83_GL001114 [Agrilactobacillus composti DSM 18527 = JCM 14202]|uniref:Dithiol-disulfide isomerase n=1 Tax=Agrilactobacillus composti DSM 18527 = JCM 14202 TaxID=1423734 RepID=X0PE38_9LACO|nr:DsbA family protein [Agrilactobacillus composti]KRM31111.1 hypothetical protein FC83_GL001114 [Agrilactobacillus composti DSM 18527 = JCM 14202]GAF39503.1 hypothetical protein JCM14202_1368 [Agrilactobacillus composti DSM 18527 = JCM 14202]